MILKHNNHSVLVIFLWNLFEIFKILFKAGLEACLRIDLRFKHTFILFLFFLNLTVTEYQPAK